MVVNIEGGGPLTHSNNRRDDWTVYTYVMREYWTHWYNHHYTYMYVDNVDQAKGPWGSWTDGMNNNRLGLGSWRVTNSSYRFLGDIAEVLTWAKHISTAERQDVNDRMCAKYVCKNLVLSEGANFVKSREQKIWNYETLATPNYVYTHPVTVRTGGKACCRMLYKAFMKGNTNAGGTSNLLSTGSSPIGYHNTARQITFKTPTPGNATSVTHTVVIRTYIIGNDAFNLDVEVTFKIELLKAVDGLNYKLPLYHYLADNYDGTSIWKDIGTEKNNMTKRYGHVTKQLSSNGASYKTVKFANNGGQNPYLQ
jgi:hypothetical protein